MKQFILFFILKCCLCSSQTQSIAAVKRDSLAISADKFIGFDAFRSCYFIKNDVFYKNSDQDLYQYQNLYLGKLSNIDINNPLKIILFYEEFNSVVILDNQLNEIQKIEFSKLDYPVVAAAVGIAERNQIWVYNTLNQQIGLYDWKDERYKNVTIPIKDALNYYQTNFNYFSWIDSKNHWMSSSVYGKIADLGVVEVSKNIQFVASNQVLYYKDDAFYCDDKNKKILSTFKINEKSFQNFYFSDNILSIFTNDQIINYTLILPQ